MKRRWCILGMESGWGAVCKAFRKRYDTKLEGMLNGISGLRNFEMLNVCLWACLGEYLYLESTQCSSNACAMLLHLYSMMELPYDFTPSCIQDHHIASI